MSEGQALLSRTPGIGPDRCRPRSPAFRDEAPTAHDTDLPQCIGVERNRSRARRSPLFGLHQAGLGQQGQVGTGRGERGSTWPDRGVRRQVGDRLPDDRHTIGQAGGGGRATRSQGGQDAAPAAWRPVRPTAAAAGSPCSPMPHTRTLLVHVALRRERFFWGRVRSGGCHVHPFHQRSTRSPRQVFHRLGPGGSSWNHWRPG